MQFDLIAVGGGFAGLTAACRAAQLGLKVAVLEKETADRYLCNSRYTSGVCNVMGHYMLSPPEELERLIMAGSDNTARPELARAIATNARRTVEWLRSQGARMLELDRNEGRQVVLAPPRRFVEGLDWEGRGGDVLLRTLQANLEKAGGQLLRGTCAVSLRMADGRCVGVEATQSGKTVRFDAGAVVLADGGFPANPEMIARHICRRPDRLLVRAAPNGRGDSIRMAEAAGAATGGYGAFYGHLHHKDAMTSARLWPYPHFDAIAAVSMLVGPDGRRFTDEGLGGVCMTNALAHLDDPLSAWAVYDEAMWMGEPGRKGPVAVNPYLESAGGWMHSAPDLESLAAKAGLPAQAFIKTVRDYNEAVEQNRIEALSPARSTSRFKPLPIRTAPFHAVPLCAGITGTMGGIAIDANAQALRPDATPIPGLYVAGTPVSGLEGGPRAGYVGGLSKGFILGMLAGEHAAARKGAAAA
jgi:fumarate reductase flavoprotein subunit